MPESISEIKKNLPVKPVAEPKNSPASNPVSEKKTAEVGHALSGEKVSQDVEIKAKNDVPKTDNPKLLEYGINLDEPLVITEELKKKIQDKGEVRFLESLKKGAKNVVPFASAGYEAYKGLHLLATVKKMEEEGFENLTKEEREEIILFQLENAENELRGSSFMAKVGTGLTHLPAFAGEFALTGGLYRAGATASKAALSAGLKAAAKKVAEVGIKKAGAKATAKFAAAKVGEVAVGSAVRSVGLAHRAIGNYAERRVENTTVQTDKGLQIETTTNKENAALTATKAVADNYIETLSEQSGAMFGFAGSKFLGKATANSPKLAKVVKALTPSEGVKNVMTKTGFNGIGEEFMEERLGGFLRGLTGIEGKSVKDLENERLAKLFKDFKDKKITAEEFKKELGNSVTKWDAYWHNLYDLSVPSLEQAGVELTTTAIWGGTMHGATSPVLVRKERKAFRELEKYCKISGINYFNMLNALANKDKNTLLQTVDKLKPLLEEGKISKENFVDIVRCISQEDKDAKFLAIDKLCPLLINSTISNGIFVDIVRRIHQDTKVVQLAAIDKLMPLLRDGKINSPRIDEILMLISLNNGNTKLEMFDKALPLLNTGKISSYDFKTLIWNVSLENKDAQLEMFDRALVLLNDEKIDVYGFVRMVSNVSLLNNDAQLEMFDKALPLLNTGKIDKYLFAGVVTCMREADKEAQLEMFNKVLPLLNTEKISSDHFPDLICIVSQENKNMQFEVFDKLIPYLNEGKISGDNFASTIGCLRQEDKDAQLTVIDKLIPYLNEGKISGDNFECIINLIKKTDKDAQLTVIDKLIPYLNNGKISSDNFAELIAISHVVYIYTNVDELVENLANFKEQVLRKPELFVSGEEYENEAEMINDINKFFLKDYICVIILSAIYDSETMDYLFRTRLDNVEDHIYNFSQLSNENMNLLRQLNNALDIEGKPFIHRQKTEFVDLLLAYQKGKINTDKMKTMIENNRVDIQELNFDLFKKILQDMNIPEEEISKISLDTLTNWDLKNIHLLASEIRSGKDDAFADILKAGVFESDFKAYLHNTKNIYGQTNAKTKDSFEKLGLNYGKWVNPSGEHNIQFTSMDKNTEQLKQITTQIQEDMNALMQTPAKGLIKKRLPAKYFKEDEFVVPQNIANNKAELKKLVEFLLDTSEHGQLAQIWTRAQGNVNSENAQRAQVARTALTVLDHLTQRISDIENVQEAKSKKTLNWTIKMWDRIPGKDIFQGNYSTCCIGMGNGNGSAMPHFILDTAYNMIELVDNNSGNIVGNALCYFVKDKNGKPAFIIDNIEIKNSVKPSTEIGIQLRDQMAQYAANVAKEVTGNDNTSVYMSSSYNDVSTSDLSEKSEKISLLGEIDCENIYMDLFDGWVGKSELTQKCDLLKLK